MAPSFSSLRSTNQNRTEPVKGFLDAFKEEHPEITVEVEHAPSMGYSEKLRILFLGGNPPDVKFLTSKRNQEAVAHSVQAIPARRSVATSAAFSEPAGFSHLAFIVAAAPHTDSVQAGRFAPRFAGSSKAKDELSRGVESLWTSLDPERRNALELLETLQPRLEAIVAGE